MRTVVECLLHLLGRSGHVLVNQELRLVLGGDSAQIHDSARLTDLHGDVLEAVIPQRRVDLLKDVRNGSSCPVGTRRNRGSLRGRSRRSRFAYRWKTKGDIIIPRDGGFVEEKGAHNS